jgi:uncharacterized protein (TIGR02599 family)
MNFIRSYPSRRIKSAFTLVELLVSLAILAVLLTIIAQVLGQVQRVWSGANSKVAQFREARRAMDRITTNLSQATLHTYLQHYYGGADPFKPPSKTLNTAPLGYVRYSELQFVCGQASALVAGSGDQIGHAVFFQAPLGGATDITSATGAAFVNLPTALSACGYYVSYGSDTGFRPTFLNQRNHPERERFRLYEYRPPIESNSIYGDVTVPAANPGVPNPAWYANTADWSRPVAENIVYLVCSPKRVRSDNEGEPRDIAPNYAYNSSPGIVLPQGKTDYQLPPLVEITVVALDEASAKRMAETEGGARSLPSGLFTNATDTDFRRDVETLETYLNSKKLNYRIFTSTIPIRNSKWGL